MKIVTGIGLQNVFGSIGYAEGCVFLFFGIQEQGRGPEHKIIIWALF